MAVVVGSVSLAAAEGSSVVGSVALSLSRECPRPLVVVKVGPGVAEGRSGWAAAELQLGSWAEDLRWAGQRREAVTGGRMHSGGGG